MKKVFGLFLVVLFSCSCGSLQGLSKGVEDATAIYDCGKIAVECEEKFKEIEKDPSKGFLVVRECYEKMEKLECRKVLETLKKYLESVE